MWVSEHARYYLTHLGRRYEQRDLMEIARGQCGLEDDAIRGVTRVQFCDTDMITIRIWSEEVFGHCAPELIALSQHRHYDHWLLCRPDFPWEPDPLRENPHDRDRLFDVYEQMLQALNKPFTTLSGLHELHLRDAVKVVDGLLIRGSGE
jgi:nicotinamide riboside kinase